MARDGAKGRFEEQLLWNVQEYVELSDSFSFSDMQEIYIERKNYCWSCVTISHTQGKTRTTRVLRRRQKIFVVTCNNLLVLMCKDEVRQILMINAEVMWRAAVVFVLSFRTSRGAPGRDYAAPQLQSETRFAVNIPKPLTLPNCSTWFIPVEIKY